MKTKYHFLNLLSVFWFIYFSAYFSHLVRFTNSTISLSLSLSLYIYIYIYIYAPKTFNHNSWRLYIYIYIYISNRSIHFWFICRCRWTAYLAFIRFWFNSYSMTALWCSLRGVMDKVLDYSFEVSKFELQSQYHVRFQTNTLRKYMNPLIP